MSWIRGILAARRDKAEHNREKRVSLAASLYFELLKQRSGNPELLERNIEALHALKGDELSEYIRRTTPSVPRRSGSGRRSAT